MASLAHAWEGGASALPTYRPRPLRPCPPDFAATYIANGYDECELIYGAAPMTVKRWLEETGSDWLRAARAEYVRRARRAKAELRERRPTPPTVVEDGLAVPPAVVAEAANWLRTMRNGGWFCAPTGHGDWWLGTNRRTPAQIVAFAAAKGFDAADAALRNAMEAGNA